jgi:competence protein ComEA
MAMFGNRKFDTQKLLVTAVGVIAVATAAVVLLRDVKNLAGSGGASEGSLIVNINTASEAELISLPGIGETRAALIIAGRPYGSVDDLDRITGIGGKTLESLRPFVTVDGETRKQDRGRTSITF